MTLNSNRKSKYDTKFGASVSVSLAEARMSQNDLAEAANTSVGYTNQIITGRKPASKAWLDIVAECLDLPPDKKQELFELANEKRQRSKFNLPPYKE